jgi:translation initiation factor 1
LHTQISFGRPQIAGLKELVKELKRTLACGGTLKDNKIELQGDHRDKVKQILVSKNYRAEQIDVR